MFVNHSVRRAHAARRAACLVPLVFLAPLLAADPASFDPTLLDAFHARPLGPANMGGRIVDLAVAEGRPATMYVASASGGLWKTINRGTTWQPVFESQHVSSLGAVAVAPSDPDVVWVGTGEANARNSVSWGDGVYKSTDGGKTWNNMGLRETAHVGRIVVHPKDPDVVFVAALGRLWGPNAERGLYKTTDGGQNWRQVKFLDDDTGFLDLALDPSAPDTLYASAFRCRRDAFSGGNPAVQFGLQAGLYRSTDGGETWTKLTAGLPDRPLGRCGVSVYRKDPRVVYAVVPTDQTDVRTVPGQAARRGGKVETGGVFRTDDKGQTWTKLNDLCPRPFYFGQIRVDPNDDKRVYVLGVSLFVSNDGGKTFRSGAAPGIHVDHHALWIDPHDSAHLVLGNDGGLSCSYDRGVTWEHWENLPIAQFYAVAADLRRPYRVYGGLQDNGTWSGPSATHGPDGITNADWSRVIAADGFHCQVSPTDPDTVYAEGQYGRLQRINVRTGTILAIRPAPASGEPAYRFNWSSPLLLSPHNPRTLYYGGNHVFRSVNRGGRWDVISPDLTRGEPGPSKNNGHTITTLAESPLRPGLLYAGTDDGRVHVHRPGAPLWTDVSEHVPSVPPDRWVTRLECSHFAEGTAYLALDRHRNDDRAPYLFKTTDYGAAWQPLAGGLPPGGPVHVVREDLRNRDLLFAGTEFGLFVSLDGGAAWHRLKAGLPTVAVHDLLIHPRDRDLIVATHGRGIYVLDIAPLEELTPEVRSADAHLFDVKPAVAFHPHGSHGKYGAKTFAVPNPPFGATIHYYLREAAAKPVHVLITDALGNTVADLQGSKEAGLHSLTWPLRQAAASRAGPTGVLVAPGDYVARLKAGDRVLSKPVRVEAED